MITIYTDPTSYFAVGRTLLRILEGFVISMLIGTALGLLMGLKRFTNFDVVNTKELRRKVAAKVLEANEWTF